MPDWIQPEDQPFHIQNNALRTWLGVLANTAPTGLNSNEINALLNAGTAWDAAYAAKIAHDLAAPPIITAKTSTRANLENLMRPIVKVLRAKHQSGLLTDTQMVAAGIPLLDTTQTPSSTPTTRPVLTITPAQRLEHLVRWSDETTPGSRAKPAGVKELELRIALITQGQPAPTDPKAFSYYRVRDPASPNTVGYDSADAGKQACMVGCWVSTRGARGPWSAIVSETIRA